MEFTKGNILRAETEAIVNPVNCVGFMGRGIAAQFKRSHPENFSAYEAACKRKQIVPGKILLTAQRLADEGWVEGRGANA